MAPKLEISEYMAFLIICLDHGTPKNFDWQAIGDTLGLRPEAARMRLTRLRKLVESGFFNNAVVVSPNDKKPPNKQLLALARAGGDALKTEEIKEEAIESIEIDVDDIKQHSKKRRADATSDIIDLDQLTRSVSPVKHEPPAPPPKKRQLFKTLSNIEGKVVEQEPKKDQAQPNPPIEKDERPRHTQTPSEVRTSQAKVAKPDTDKTQSVIDEDARKQLQFSPADSTSVPQVDIPTYRQAVAKVPKSQTPEKFNIIALLDAHDPPVRYRSVMDVQAPYASSRPAKIQAAWTEPTHQDASSPKEEGDIQPDREGARSRTPAYSRDSVCPQRPMGHQSRNTQSSVAQETVQFPPRWPMNQDPFNSRLPIQPQRTFPQQAIERQQQQRPPHVYAQQARQQQLWSPRMSPPHTDGFTEFTTGPPLQPEFVTERDMQTIMQTGEKPRRRNPNHGTSP